MDEKKFYQHLNYLNHWKPALDAKSKNKVVESALREGLKDKGRIKILDCGTGTERGLISLIENRIITKGDVETFDISSELISDMPRLMQEFCSKNGLNYQPIRYDKKDDFIFNINNKSDTIDIKIHGFQESAYELPKRINDLKEIDLITGQAIIEHVNQAIVFPILNTFLKKDGLIYFSMNCDGWFNYSPSNERERDEKIVGLFNDLALNNQEFKNQDGAIFGGEAFCGRNLPYRFKEYGIETIAYGPSDWVVHPFNQTDSETQFMRYTAEYIKEVCSSALASELRNKWDINEREVYNWYAEKLNAVIDNQLGFTCVQKDILGKKIK